MSLFNYKKCDRGASMVEFAIFVPILVLLFIGLVEMGRLLSEYTWVSQASYQTALLGSENLPGIGEGVMGKRVDDLNHMQDRHFDPNHQPRIPLEATPYATGPTDRYVRVQLKGSLSPLMNSSYNLGVSAVSVAPLLVSNTKPSDNLNVFSGGSCMYDCAGAQICCGTSCAGVSPAGYCSFAPKPNDAGNYVTGCPTGMTCGGGGGSGGCFLPDTAIAMDSGEQKPIIDLKVGDKIKSVNLKNGKQEQGVITKLFVHDVNSYLIVNDRIKITPNHPVYSHKKWVPIGKLRLGDKLTTAAGTEEKIVSLRLVEGPIKVYNLEVEPHHNYLASGVLVHNKFIIPIDMNDN